jgi:hypothetical protein
VRRLLLLLLLSPRPAAADPPWVKPANAVSAITAALAKPDPKAPAGAGRVVALVEKGDPAKDGAAIRADLVKAGFTILDDRSEPDSFAVTFEAKTGERVRVALGPYQGQISVVAKPAATKLPGPCVPIPNVDAPVYVTSSAINQDGDFVQGTNFWGFKTVRLVDVDGDGLDDAFVPVAKKNACPEEVSWRVYAVRGTCGHDLGVVGPGSLDHAASIATPLDASGFRPLVLVAESSKHGKKSPVPEHTTTTRSFAVRRGAYAQTNITQRSGICHHCATWTCNSP